MLFMRLIVCYLGMSNFLRRNVLLSSLHIPRTFGYSTREAPRIFSRTFYGGSGTFHHSRTFHSGSRTAASAAASDAGVDDHESSASIPMKDLNLPELKILLKKLGGTPGTLRKAEILALCEKMSGVEHSPNVEHTFSEIAEVIISSNLNVDNVLKSEVKTATTEDLKEMQPKKKNLRSLHPILDGPQSIEQFQLPTIKGDISTISTDIVEDLAKLWKDKREFGSNNTMDGEIAVEKRIENRVENRGSITGNSAGNVIENERVNVIKNERGNVVGDDMTAELERSNVNRSSPIREYVMGKTFNSNGSLEYRDLSTGQHYWAHHPTGPARDDRLLEGSQAVAGVTAGGPGSGMGDMDLTFLGTASCVPSLTRGVSCVAYRYKSDIWLFDCGEGSQQQMMKSRIRPSKIRKIFITHLHGDHSFGLPGVLCLIGQATMTERDKERQERDPRKKEFDPRFEKEADDFILDIYGPEGTRDYVRAAIQLTYSKVVNPYRIHELKDVPNLLYKNQRNRQPLPEIRTRCSAVYGERPGGQDIFPDANGHYHLLDEGEMIVKAAPISHSIPCVGYVVSEKPRAGRLKIEDVLELVNKNKKELGAAFNLHDPNKMFAILKDMKPGSSLTFPDGTVVNADEIQERPRKGRKIVILGDTCNSDVIVPLAMDADVIIHEATNAFIKDMESNRCLTEQELERDTTSHGHSTPQMAGRFVKKINGKKLLMTHFSSRYRGDEFEFSMKIMWRMEQMARKILDFWGKNDVIAAWDNMCLPVRTREDEEIINRKEDMIRKGVDSLYDTSVIHQNSHYYQNQINSNNQNNNQYSNSNNQNSNSNSQNNNQNSYQNNNQNNYQNSHTSQIIQNNSQNNNQNSQKSPNTQNGYYNNNMNRGNNNNSSNNSYNNNRNQNSNRYNNGTQNIENSQTRMRETVRSDSTSTAI